jgi:small-conductance mechanosensitive channel
MFLVIAFSAEPAANPPTLFKLQVPIETVSRWLDQLLQRWFDVGPLVSWALHLLLALLLTTILAWLVGVLGQRLGHFAARRERPLLAQLLLLASPTLRWMVLLAGFADAIEDAWPAVKGPARWLAGTLYVLSAIVATRGVARLGLLLIESLMRPALDPAAVAGKSESGERRTLAGVQLLAPLVQRLLSILVWLIGAILVLDHFGQNVGSVVAALGVTSLAIGLAAQQTLGNIIAGFVLAADHPFRLGDRVKLPSGESGEVLEIGMRATQIRLSDGSLLIVPNADLVTSRLVNQSTETAVRVEVRLSAPASLNIEKLSEQLLEEAALCEPSPLPSPPPSVQLLSVGDKVELALILWLPRGAAVPRAEEQLRRAALKRLQPLLPPPLSPSLRAGT